MQDFLNNHPFAFIPFLVLFWCAFWSAISFLIATVSGWRSLAEKFRSDSAFMGTTWRFQSARMRWNSRYGNCLNVGVDSAGLKLSILFLFRPGHPPLLIPWSEISIAERRTVLFVPQVKLLLGREEQIPFVIRGTLADRMKAAAGPNWPIEPVS